MKLAKNCQYYLKYGLCAHKDAPKPSHSRCLGELQCEVFKRKKVT